MCAKTDDLNLIPMVAVHMVAGENQLLRVVLTSTFSHLHMTDI